MDCYTIQRCLVVSKRQTTIDILKTFTKLMLAGKVNAVLKLLTTKCYGVHEVNDEKIRNLKEKHPKPAPIQVYTLFYGLIQNLLCFVILDEGTIFKAACLTKEASGLSHMNAIYFGTSVLAQNVKKKINILETK